MFAQGFALLDIVNSFLLSFTLMQIPRRSPAASCSCSASLALFVNKYSMHRFCNKEGSLVDGVIMGKAQILNNVNNLNE